MGLGHSPSIVTNGLVMCLDAANYKSFKGVPATNILNGIYYQQSNQNTSLYKVANGSETVYIPSLGYVNSLYVDFYNDYNGGSGSCCPNLFSYGTGLAVSPSTTYTYSIIYKTTTGYSNPNYMYRYEYNGSGAYLTEGGVHSTDNRISLGDGWWFAWGQFTTQATTATLNTYLFHYEYATQNRVYVYKAALYQGTYVIPPEHMLNSSENRGATVATGGGWADIIGGGNNGELVNGPTYSSANGGSLVFDGTNDYVATSAALAGSFASFTVIIWFYPTSVTNYQNPIDCNYAYNGSTGNIGPRLEMNSGGNLAWYYSNISNDNNQFYIHSVVSSGLAANTWHCAAITYNGGTNTSTTYYNGNPTGLSRTSNGSPTGFVGVMNNVNIARGFHLGGAERIFAGRVSNTFICNRALTAAEIQQNFNALRGRFGV